MSNFSVLKKSKNIINNRFGIVLQKIRNLINLAYQLTDFDRNIQLKNTIAVIKIVMIS